MVKFDHEMKVLRLLGTLWSQNYKNNGPHLATVEVNLDLLKQAQVDLQEAIDCADRHTTPVYHTELWLPVRLKEGVPTQIEGLRELPMLFNRLTAPSLVWHSGIDYDLAADGVISFRESPMEQPLVPTWGEKGDREALLWSVGAKFDRNYLSRHFGCLVGLEKPSSENYRDLLNAIFDTWVLGTTQATLLALANALLGVPLAQKDGEVVQVLYFDARGPFVATDAQIYRIPADAVACAQRGHRLYRGEPVVKLAEILVDSSLRSNVVILRAPKEGIDETLLRQALPDDFELRFE